jgi:hypothetical protein
MAACSQPPLQLNTIQLGRGLNPDKTVTGFTTRFKPDDTIYAAVVTSNAGAGKVKPVGSRPFRVETGDGKAQYTFPNITPKH